ncbi:MAG: class I SAM-dependent methyltransferase [Solirubrobacteraceae bacterium]
MASYTSKIDPMATDPGRWGHSLANLAELVFACLDAAAPRSLIEVGAYAGDITALLLEWSAASGTRIVSIDPDPHERLVKLAQASPQLTLDRRTSLTALAELPRADAIIIDGDHNYYTVSEELRLIAAPAGGQPLPLLICHDLCWPHARRDSYYALEQIPVEHRQPTVHGGYVFPGDPGLHEGGLVYQWPARREGGAHNGVLTAVEDFVNAIDGLRFALVPAFFGLGVIWQHDATYAGALEQILAPWDRNPMLERLEANRVLHLASSQLATARAGWRQEAINSKDAVLRKLLASRTFALAVALSRVRQGGTPAFSKDEIRRALDGR